MKENKIKQGCDNMLYYTNEDQLSIDNILNSMDKIELKLNELLEKWINDITNEIKDLH